MFHNHVCSFSFFVVAAGLALAANGCAVQPQGDSPASDAPSAKADSESPSSAAQRALDPEKTHSEAEVRVEASRLPKPAVAAKHPFGEDGPKESTIGIFRQPDLTVVAEDHVWRYSPQYGWYSAYQTGFTVKNIGSAASGSFHVAVLNGEHSFGFDTTLAAGASEYHEIDGIDCGASAVVIVNTFNAAYESNYDNNVVSVSGFCNW